LTWNFSLGRIKSSQADEFFEFASPPSQIIGGIIAVSFLKARKISHELVTEQKEYSSKIHRHNLVFVQCHILLIKSGMCFPVAHSASVL